MTPTPTSPLLPEPLKVVAWCYYDGERENFPSGPRAILDRSVVITFGRQPHCRNETPLVRLSDAEASLNALRAEVAALRVDGERYRWLRDKSEWEPFDSRWLIEVDIYGTPSSEMDAAIDQAIAKDRS